MSAAGLRSLTAVALFAAAALCHADPDTAASYEPAPGVLGPSPGAYAATQVLVPATLSAGARAAYRFSGQEAWLPFDRPLYLSAFPGEERHYSIEFGNPRSPSPTTLSYAIDLRPPEPPTVQPQPPAPPPTVTPPVEPPVVVLPPQVTQLAVVRYNWTP
ncbi:MAG TPA: hypothetical protein PLW80_05620, partial [Spirochaetales bacterium]|nr:hypothetical protein [Spirochaetales bacterium]